MTFGLDLPVSLKEDGHIIQGGNDQNVDNVDHYDEGYWWTYFALFGEISWPFVKNKTIHTHFSP